MLLAMYPSLDQSALQVRSALNRIEELNLFRPVDRSNTLYMFSGPGILLKITKKSVLNSQNV